MMDLKVVTDAKGGSFYRDHLPVIGDFGAAFRCTLAESVADDLFSASSMASSSQATLTGATSAANLDLMASGPSLDVAAGDRVRIDAALSVDVDLIRSLQTGHGGWNEAIVAAIGQCGTVEALDADGDAVVSFPPSGHRWTLNPALLNVVQRAPRSAAAVRDSPSHSRTLASPSSNSPQLPGNAVTTSSSAQFTSTSNSLASTCHSQSQPLSLAAAVSSASLSSQAQHTNRDDSEKNTFTSLASSSQSQSQSQSQLASQTAASAAQPVSFAVGDFVRISDEVEMVKTYQRGHGEWTDAMQHVSGTCS